MNINYHVPFSKCVFNFSNNAIFIYSFLSFGPNNRPREGIKKNVRLDYKYISIMMIHVIFYNMIVYYFRDCNCKIHWSYSNFQFHLNLGICLV